jgi:DMSO/TMAO reductase YedYZ molybdopterin-dependent catalytic subunit
MKRKFWVAAIFSVFPLAIYAYSQNPAASIDVRGDILKPRHWTISDLKQQFPKEIRNVTFTSGLDKEHHTGVGVPLLPLLQAAEPRTEEAPKHYDLTFLVVLEALDRYRVFFSLAELLPSCGRAQAFLIWEVDGMPLPEKQAPLRLVVLSDHGHDRYIYGIAGITLVDGTKLANKLPANQ